MAAEEVASFGSGRGIVVAEEESADAAPFELGAQPGAGGGAGFNRNGVRRIATPVERYLAAGLFNYQLTDGIRAFAEVTYAKVNSSSQIEALPLDATDELAGFFQGVFAA